MFTVAMVKKYIRSALILLIVVGLAGCANFGRPKLNSVEDYYDSAQNYLEKENFTLAIERLTELQNKYPFSYYAEISNFDLMYAYFESSKVADALIQADRFIRLNPDHPNIDYASFVRAMSYYELYMTNRGILGRGDPAIRSPEQGNKAFDALTSFNQRYPNSEFRPEALKAMVILKDALARHELIVSNFYIRRGAWVAAAERAKTIIDHFPGVSSEGDAHVVLIEAYDSMNLMEEKTKVLRSLQTKFPEHAVFSRGEYRSPKWEEDRWWVKFLTFGMTS